jgi:hypothetical protein
MFSLAAPAPIKPLTDRDERTTVSFTQEKGAALEAAVANHLTSHGYGVERNVLRTGRSGATHELDVVGRRSDGLATTVLIVECKAWGQPIDKEIVYKLAAEIADLGAAKGIIAATGGWTPQALAAAKQASIDLWGPGELARRLGRPAVDQLQVGPARTPATGWAFATDESTGRREAGRAARGGLSLSGREQEVWFGPHWYPFYVARLAITRLEGRVRKTPQVHRTWNSYEALQGRYAGKTAAPPTVGSIDVACGHVRPVIKINHPKASIDEAMKRLRSVTTESAKARHVQNLTNLGVELPLRSLDVEDTQLLHLPIWMSWLQHGPHERIVAVDGRTGKVRPGLSETLTANIGRLRETDRHQS